MRAWELLVLLIFYVALASDHITNQVDTYQPVSYLPHTFLQAPLDLFLSRRFL